MFYRVVKYLPVLIFYFSAVALAESEENERSFNKHIVGGSDAKIEDFPYLVSLRYHKIHFCGGSIYSPKIIITASHCTVGKRVRSLRVYAGSEKLHEDNAFYVQVATTVSHPFYNMSRLDYDVAFWVLAEPLVFNDKIKPIPLATTVPPVGAIVTVSGWGYLKPKSMVNSEQLQSVQVKMVSSEQCAAAYLNILTNRMICASVEEGGKDGCTNDSGGPLEYEGQLLGVVSFGMGCADKMYPGVYASIPVLREWIVNNVAKFE